VLRLNCLKRQPDAHAVCRSNQASWYNEMAHGKKPLRVLVSRAGVTLFFLLGLPTAGLVPLQVKELHGIAGQHGLFLVFRHSGKLLLNELS
jgi:hypothetical protein